MKPRTIQYRRGRTINTGDYESVRIEIGVEAELDPGEDMDDALDELREQVAAQIREEATAIRKSVGRSS